MNIDVNKLFTISLVDIKDLTTNLDILFEDGVVIKDCDYKAVILFRHFLDFRLKIPFVLTSKLWIVNYFRNGYYTQDTYLDLYSDILEQLARKEIKLHKTNTIIKPLLKLMYETIDSVNKNLLRDIIEYAVSADIDDILPIQFDDKMIASLIVADKEKSQAAINETYTTLNEVMNKPIYKDNVMSLFYLSGVVSVGQLNQLFGSRGFVTELDNKLFKYPMTNSFNFGFKTMYDAAIESKAGGKALFLSGKSIQTAEYMSRELQQLTMTVESVVIGDCGDPVYLDHYVKGVIMEDGLVVSRGDLKNLIGKHYLDHTGKELVISKHDTHLIDTTIKLRSGIYCGVKDNKSICSSCLGEVSLSILDGQNLGHMALSELARFLTQVILSAKHLLQNARASKVKLSITTKKFLIIKNNQEVFFKAGVLAKKQRRVYLRLRQAEVWGLQNAINVEDAFAINMANVSKVTEAILVTKDPKGAVADKEVSLKLKAGGRSAFLSLPFLAFIKKHGYETESELDYLIDINDFDNKLPIFEYPVTEFSYSALSSEFKSLIKKREMKTLNDVIRSDINAHTLVQNLFDLVNSKLDINITLIEVLVRALRVSDLTKGNYNLPSGANKNINIGGLKIGIDHRSLGASYGWDDLPSKVVNPQSFMDKDKPSTPLDVCLKPNEVLKNDIEERRVALQYAKANIL